MDTPHLQWLEDSIGLQDILRGVDARDGDFPLSECHRAHRSWNPRQPPHLVGHAIANLHVVGPPPPRDIDSSAGMRDAPEANDTLEAMGDVQHPGAGAGAASQPRLDSPRC